jgi:uncharacterized membrane protein
MLNTLLPDPLHPAVVHLPIALALLAPLFAIGALVVIRRGARPLRTWPLVVAVLALLSLSAWASVETGEAADEQVEAVVADAPIETHEEAAEAFLGLSVGVLAIAALGLLGGRPGQVARLAGTVGALGLVIAGWRVGHTGGELVYEYGAASAYTTTPRADRLASTTTPAEDDR